MYTLPYRKNVSAQIPTEQLEGIGNIDDMPDQYGETYRYIRRSVEPRGLLVHPQVTFKLYHLIRENVPLQPGTAEGLEEFLVQEIEAGNIDLKQRIGFTILGQGFVSVNVWGKGNGLFSQNYSVENSYPKLSRMPLERTAIACTWDSRIMNFELRLWHRYLLTERTPADKRKYLDTFISGDLEDEDVCAAPSWARLTPAKRRAAAG
jgi:hypothetical protein